MRKLSEVVVRSGVRMFHDIIPVALFSITGAMLLAPLLFVLPIGVSVVLLPSLFVLLQTGALYATNEMLDGQRPRWRDMWIGMGKCFIPALVFAALCTVFLVILVSTWWYYGSKSGVMYWALAIFQTYFIAMVLVSQLYTLPLVVQERIGIFQAMGRSVKLFLAHPGYTIGAWIQLLSVAALLAVTVVGFGALYFGAAGVYLNLVTANVRKPAEEEQQSDPQQDQQKAAAQEPFRLDGVSTFGR